MNPLHRCLHAKVKYWNEPKQVMPKSEDLSRSQEINAIWTFDMVASWACPHTKEASSVLLCVWI